MSGSAEQLSLWAQGPAVLDKFEARLRALRQHGLLLWTGVLRSIFRDLLRQREAVYGQLMLLEAEVEAGADSVVLLERIGRIKGYVAALLLTLCLWQVCAPNHTEPMRRSGGAVRVVRLVARRGREELC